MNSFFIYEPTKLASSIRDISCWSLAAASLAFVSKSSPSPAKIDLKGKHELVYSASPSASSGALGPLTGKVTQSFLDETMFINRVEFFGGIAKIELYAERKVLDDNKIRVKFRHVIRRSPSLVNCCSRWPWNDATGCNNWNANYWPSTTGCSIQWFGG